MPPSTVSVVLFAILAIFMQTLVPQKAVGWMLMLLFVVAQITLDRLGFEHNLYQYAGNPGTPLSDMNGQGDFARHAFAFLAADPGLAAYCATKGGVHALTRAMAVDLGAQGIRVNAIAPGWIRSELSDNYINAQADPDAAWEDLHRMHPVGRVGEPADVGQLAVYLAGDHAAFVTGQVIVIDGGRTSKLPLPF